MPPGLSAPAKSLNAFSTHAGRAHPAMHRARGQDEVEGIGRQRWRFQAPVDELDLAVHVRLGRVARSNSARDLRAASGNLGFDEVGGSRIESAAGALARRARGSRSTSRHPAELPARSCRARDPRSRAPRPGCRYLSRDLSPRYASPRPTRPRAPHRRMPGCPRCGDRRTSRRETRRPPGWRACYSFTNPPGWGAAERGMIRGPESKGPRRLRAGAPVPIVGRLGTRVGPDHQDAAILLATFVARVVRRSGRSHPCRRT